MKKLLAGFVAITMMATMIAGCSNGSASSSATSAASQPSSTVAATSAENGGENGKELSGTLKLWTHQNEPWARVYEEDIAKFTALHPGVTIELESFPYTDFQSKLQTSLISGNGADIFVIFGSWAAEYMPTGALSKVPDDLAALMDEDFYPSAKGGFTYEGAYYGLPWEYNIEYGGMLVNKKLFEERGLSYPTTWEELEKISDEVSVRNGEIMDMRGFEFVGYDGVTNLFLSMILSNGGQYLKEDGVSVDFTTPEAVEAMTRMVDYVKTREWTNMDGITNPTEGAFYALYKDAAFMDMIGPWAVSVGVENYGLEYGTDFDYILMPQHSKENRFAAETGWGCVVSEKSPQKELAWEFLRFMAEPENMMAHNIGCAQLPASKSVAESPEYGEAMAYAKPLLGILENGQYMGNMNTDVLKQTINNMFIELTTTDNYASVEEALKALQESLDMQLKK